MPQELVSSSGPKKVLLPIDFRSSSEAALAMGTALARSFGAELHILHVIPMLPVINGVDDFPQMEPAFEINFILGYHCKTGHTLSVQKRPTGLAEDVIVLPCRSVHLQGAD